MNSIGDDASKLDEDQRRNLRTRIEELILPIRDSVLATEKKLNEKLEKTLSKKENKKWLRYQKQQHKKLIPEQASQQQYTSPQGMNRRNRRY